MTDEYTKHQRFLAEQNRKGFPSLFREIIQPMKQKFGARVIYCEESGNSLGRKPEDWE